MPFIAILKELVSSVDGAAGAIVIEADGEAVQWYATGDEDLLRLRAAYVALAAQACRETAARLGLSTQDAVLITYAGASFVVAELESNYLLILELQTDANIGQALFKIRIAAEKAIAVL